MPGQTFKDIFTPVSGDYALISLRRVVGCTLDKIWGAADAGGNSCAQADMVATAAGYFNIAVAIVASILVTYTVWTAIANTASEGEAMGNGTSTKYTVARLGLGAIFLMPISGGFSLAQILVLQILVWGSGAADNLWAKVSPMILVGGYNQVATLPEDDSSTRKDIANAIQARAQGYICQKRLNEVAGMFNSAYKNTAAIEFYDKTDQSWWNYNFTSGTVIKGFRDVSGMFNNSTSLCGTLQYQLSNNVISSGNDDLAAADKAARVAMDAMALNAVKQGMSQALAQVDKTASDISQQVTGQARNDARVRELISNGVQAAQKALVGGVNSAVQSADSDVKELAQKYLEDAKSSGWVFALSWQRASINVYQYFQNMVNGTSLTSLPPENIYRVLQPTSLVSALTEGFRNTTGTTQVIVDQYERDMGYLDNFSGYFSGFGSVSPSAAAGQTVSDQGFSGSSWGSWVSKAMRYVISQLQYAVQVSGTRGDAQWSDPLARLTDIGAGLSSFGGAAMGASALGSAAAKLDPTGLASSIADGAWGIGFLLASLGFWIGGILPLTPLLYFFGAVVSWLVVGVEALIAVPIWVLTYFFPAKEPSLIGASRQGWLLLFGLLARPTLIIMGLLMSMLLMWAAFSILNIMFSSVFTLVVPLASWAVGASLLSVAALVMYAVAATVVIMNSCALISELGDAALRWVEIGVQSLWSSRFGQDVTTAVGLTGSIGRGLGGIAQSMRLRSPRRSGVEPSEKLKM